MLAPRKSMQADLQAARSPYVLIICSLPVVFVCNALFLFLLLYFHMYKPETNLVNVCAQLISLRNEHFFGDTFDVLCFHMYKLRHTLKTSLCCAFYWRKPCHDHTFDLLCFHMYKPQSNLLHWARSVCLCEAQFWPGGWVELYVWVLAHCLSGFVDVAKVHFIWFY